MVARSSVVRDRSWMKVLITGALGYIGSRLVEYLRALPAYELRLLVRRVPPELSSWVCDLDIRKGDLTQPETLQGIGAGIDAVVHLAALDAPSCQREPTVALRTNVEGTLHLLEALGTDLRQFIYYSTFHVYGANGQNCVTEATAIAPTHAYGATHAMAELYAEMYARRGQFTATIVRSANTFGPPLYPGANCWTIVLNDLCRQAIAHQRLILQSSGLKARNFIPLADAVRAVELLLRKPSQAQGIYNLGGERSYSILEAAQLVQQVYREVYGQTLAIERPETKPGERRGELDYRCDRLQALGFQPKISLKETIRETLFFCEQHF